MTRLVLDASGPDASVALLHGDTVLASDRVAMKNRVREPLLPLVLALCARAGLAVGQVDDVVLGEGPGAFTSLRIAAATAKGLVHGTPMALRAVSSLVLAAATVGEASVGTRRLMTSDALRGELFAQRVVSTAEGWAPDGEVGIVPAGAVAALAEQWHATWCPAPAVAAEALRQVCAAAIRPVALAAWEPTYGRLAEAQVKWEAAHGRPLGAADGRRMDATAPEAASVVRGGDAS
jgi:tRNA threonylcarbamoyladenosine biosynthesis protein TsaB